jgi:hypothetical protein
MADFNYFGKVRVYQKLAAPLGLGDIVWWNRRGRSEGEKKGQLEGRATTVENDPLLTVIHQQRNELTAYLSNPLAHTTDGPRLRANHHHCKVMICERGRCEAVFVLQEKYFIPPPAYNTRADRGWLLSVYA